MQLELIIKWLLMILILINHYNIMNLMQVNISCVDYLIIDNNNYKIFK